MVRKIGLVHQSILNHRGGGDLTCAWILEALKDDYDLTYLTWGTPIDLKEVDDFYGTHLAQSGMKVKLIPSLTAPVGRSIAQDCILNQLGKLFRPTITFILEPGDQGTPSSQNRSLGSKTLNDLSNHLSQFGRGLKNSNRLPDPLHEVFSGEAVQDDFEPAYPPVPIAERVRFSC